MKATTLSQDVGIASDVRRLLALDEEAHSRFPFMEEKGAPEKQIFDDLPVVSVEDNLIAFGIIHQWFFQKMEEKGVLEEPIVVGNWRYQPYVPNFITLPSHAQKRLDAVNKAGFPIRQFIYGEELEVASEVKPRPEPRMPKPQVHISDQTVKTVATVALTLTVGAAMVVGYAFLLALSGIDPQLIAVVDSGADETELPWILLDSWEK